MMKNYFLALFIVSGFWVKSQNIEVVNTNLNLGNATEINASFDTLQIYNPGSIAIGVEDIDLFKVYGHYAFTVSDTSFMVLPGDTEKVAISFLPEHNINHDLALVIKTNTGFGHKSVELSGQGKFSKTYYNSTENKSEESLKTALKARLGQGYNSLGYTTARDNMYGSIDNKGGDVTCVYTNRSATFNTRAGANANSFNTEHTFPQGFYNQNEPMRSDIHHLFPTDVSANSTRNNHPFGVVANPTSLLPGGSKYGNSTFEPRDPHKGACARAMMYFVIRYQDYANHFSGQENILKQWHWDYLPSTDEENRNDDIAALQNNRNPFVDYPQFVERIHAFVSNSVAPTVEKIYLSDDTIFLATAGSGTQEYEFVIYNDGNTDISLGNVSVSDPNLSILQGPTGSMITLSPGTAMSVILNFDPQQAYNATLDFNTDVSGQNNVSIPIRNKGNIGLLTPKEVRVEVYPIPAEQWLTIKTPEKITGAKLIDLSGKSYSLGLKADQADVSNFTRGMYILQLELEGGIKIQREVILK